MMRPPTQRAATFAVFSLALATAWTTPQWSRDLGPSSGYTLPIPQLVDWNNNLASDVIVHSNDTVSVFNGPNGALLWQLPVTLPGNDWQVEHVTGFRYATVERQVPADVTGDGAADIVVTLALSDLSAENTTNRIQVYDIASRALRWQSGAMPNLQYFGPQVAQLDADPQRELVSLTAVRDPSSGALLSRTLIVFDGALGATQWTRDLGAGDDFLLPELIDWENDGKDDVVAITETEVLVFNGANGTVKWQLTLDKPLPGLQATGPFNTKRVSLDHVIPGDMDGNGLSDVLLWLHLGNETNVLQLYQINNKMRRWQKIFTNELVTITCEALNVDSDAAQELGLARWEHDAASGTNIHREVKMLDGVAGTFQWTQSVFDGHGLITIEWVDWNNDGKSDLLARMEETVRVFNGPNGNSLWNFTVPSMGSSWNWMGPQGFKPVALQRQIPANIDAVGGPDVFFVWSYPGLVAAGSNVIQVFDINSQTLRWQSDAYLGSGATMVHDGQLDSDAARELAFITGTLDFPAGGYSARTLTVLDGAQGAAPPTAPSIVQQPHSLTVVAGEPATFNVVAEGDAPLHYQWRFNGANLAGATDAAHTINSAQAVNRGNYTVVVSNPHGAVTSAVARLTVTAGPAAIRFARATYAMSEGALAAVITVTRPAGSPGTASVQFSTADGSAQAGVDYRATNGTLNFPAGFYARSFIVPILRDTADETNETVLLTLSNPSSGYLLGAPSNAVLTIIDNDAAGRVQFLSSLFVVGEGAPTAVITLQRTGGLAGGVAVDVSALPGSATDGSDFVALQTNVAFGPNQLVRSVFVPIVHDTLDENTETVQLSVRQPTGGAQLGVLSNATLRIVDNDSAGLFAFSSLVYSGSEAGGTATVRVVRTLGVASGASVTLVTSNRTALAGDDFAGTNLVLNFAAGQRNSNVVIGIFNDLLGEGPENFQASLQNPTGGATLGFPRKATVNITDDETFFQFSASNYPRLEGTGPALIVVTRSGPTVGTNQVSFSTMGLTAVDGQDFRGTNGTLTFPPGAVLRTFQVPIINDRDVEPAEIVALTLTNPTGGAVLGPRNFSTLTIISNDQ